MDPSPSMRGNALSGAANELGNTIFGVSIAHQQMRDEAEVNRLLVQYKTSAIQNFEGHKEAFANNPEASMPAFQQMLKDNLQTIKDQASNSRVRRAISKGDPWFEGRMLFDNAQWATSQRSKLDKQSLFDNANTLAMEANKVASDPNVPYVVKKEQLLAKFSAVGNLAGGAFALAHPDEAEKFEASVPKSIIKGTIYGMIDSNPAQAVTFLQEKEVKQRFDPEEISKLQEGAVNKMKGQVKDAEWIGLAKPLMDSPDEVSKVLNGDTTWTQLDQMPQTPLILDLKKMAVQTSPQAVVEQQAALTKFYDDAHSIGINIKGKTPERSVADLVKFQEELAHAYTGGLINRSTYESFNRQLATPLIGAVTKVHDPNMFERAASGIGSWFSQHAQEPQEKVDKYTGGYRFVDNYVKALGKSQEESFSLKNKYLSAYIQEMDKEGHSSATDSSGKLYTPETTAYRIMGIEKGQMMDTPLGPRIIDSHDRNGLPQHDFTKEETQMLTHLKDLKVQEIIKESKK